MTYFPLIIALSLPLFLAACAAPSPTPRPPTAPAPAASPSPTPTVIPPPVPSFAGSRVASPSSTWTTAAATASSPTTPPTQPPTRPAPATLSATPTSRPMACSVLPTGSFRTIWQSDETLRAILGCPTSNHPRITPTAWQVKTSYQAFERGAMIWSDHIGWYAQPIVFVLSSDSSYQSFQDSFDPSQDPVSSNATPPAGLVEPILGFGKVWREQPGVRERVGWGKTEEVSGSGRFEMFSGGYMVWTSQTNRTYVFLLVQNGDVVRVFDVPFSER